MRMEHWWFTARLRLKSILRWSRVERELAEELEFHLEQKIEEGVAQGLSPKEARFTIEDEGAGFNVADIPDPRDPANLFKTSGRGVLLIYNIMDEVEYNERGNRLTMVKRPESSLDHELIESLTPPDDAPEKS